MQETMRVVRAGLLCSGAVLGVLANTAIAQESEPSAAADSPAVPQEVVITGSRIQRRDYSSESPIVTVTDAALENTGDVGLDQSLNELPQFSGGANQITSATDI